MSKRALFIANAIVGENPGVSGGDVRFMEIAKAWAKKGWQIHLLSSLGGKNLCRKMGLKTVFHCFSRSRATGRLTFLGRAIKSFFLPSSLASFRKGVVYSSSEQIYDVVPGVIAKLKNRQKIKLAVVVHWLPPLKWWQRKESSFFNSLLFLISQRTGLWLAGFFADNLLAVSESTKNQIKEDFFGQHFLKKVSVVECGVNIKEIESIVKKVKKKRYEAVFLKRLQAVKGIFDLIEIWEKVIKKLPRAKLIIIGSGIDEEEAQKMATEKGLEENIEFLGTIYEPKEKFTKLAESKLFLLPSYEENWAIVIGEAMAVGVPVLAYSLDELKSVWEDNFVGIPLGNKAVFAQQIIDLLENKEKRERFSQKGLSWVKKFDWENLAEKELRIIMK